MRTSLLLIALVAAAGIGASTGSAEPSPGSGCPPGSTVISDETSPINSDFNGDGLKCLRVPEDGSSASFLTDNTYDPALVACPPGKSPVDTHLSGSPFYRPGYEEIFTSRHANADGVVCFQMNKNDANSPFPHGASGGANLVITDNL